MKFFFALLTCSIVLLASCATEAPTQTSTGPTEKAEKQSSTKVTESSSQAVGTPPGEEKTEEQQGMTEAQLVFFEAAKKNLDVEYCKKIDNQEFQKQCEVEVTENIMIKAAIDAKDSAKCDGLEREKARLQCKAEVEVAIAEQTKLQEEQNTYKSNDEILNEAQQKNDPALCDQIKDEPEKLQTCKDRVNLGLAAQTKNKELCKQIVDPGLKEQCENIPTT